MFLVAWILLWSIPTTVAYTQPQEEPKPTKFVRVISEEEKREINRKIADYSKQYGVSESVMLHIVANESQHNRFAKGDGLYKCPVTGKIAPSWGLVQINECWNPHITYEQAIDVDFSLKFLAENLSKGKCKLWSTCPVKSG